MTARPTNAYADYHAHVYFDAATIALAKSICSTAQQRFAVSVGRFHEQTIGPHPCGSCQLSFDSAQFDGLITWLDEAREDLTVLVHPLTGNDVEDHTTHASWLGPAIALNLSVFENNKDTSKRHGE